MSDSDKGGVYRLTPEEIEALRAEMKASGQWAKRQLEIDPELRHLDDRPPFADHIRQAPPLEGAIREVMEDDSLAEPAKDRRRRVPTRAELDELEAMFRELELPDEALLRKQDIEDWTPEVLTFSRQEGITFLEGWRRFELDWSVERLAKVSRVPMAVILAWEAPSPDPDLLDQAAESLGLPRELLDKTLADYPWLALQVSPRGKPEP